MQLFTVTPKEIKKFRKIKEITQKRLADILCKSVKTIQAWEQGQQKPGGTEVKVLLMMIKKPSFYKKFAEAK